MAPLPRKIVYFGSGAEFRRWLEKNHARCQELHLGFYKQGAPKSGITYQEAVDEALCFGWIDGIVRRVDDASYQHRFTPRRPRSIWSNTNVRHVERLQREGKMHAAGLAAFAARLTHRTGIYSFEQENRPRPERFPAAAERRFRANAAAWSRWEQQPPGYRRLAVYWVTSAKQQATRERRLDKLIAVTAAGGRIN